MLGNGVTMYRLPCVVAAVLAVSAALSACASTHQISAGPTNMCMNVVNHGYPEPGAPLIVRGCDPWQNQQWTLTKGGQITGVGGFCVDVQGGTAVDGAHVIYTPCSGAASQNWTVSNGTVVGIGGKCLDIEGGNPADRAPLIIASCNGAPSQQWQIH